MKCKACEKDIPTTAQVCPYCYTPVNSDNEANKSEETKIDSFGTVSGFDYSTNNDELNFGNIINIKEKEQKKAKNHFKVIRFLIFIIVILIIIFTAFILKKDKKNQEVDGHKYIISFFDEVFNMIKEPIKTSKRNGDYKINYKYGDTSYEITGKLEYDIDKNIVNATGKINDSSSYSINLNHWSLFLDIPMISDKLMLYRLDDWYLKLDSSTDNVNKIVDLIHDTLNESIKTIKYTRYDKDKVDINGTTKKAYRIEYIINNRTKREFISTFFRKIINDSTLLHELSDIYHYDYSKFQTLLIDTMMNLESKYVAESDYYTVINCYYNNDEVYGYEIDMTNDDGYKYFVELKDNKINITADIEGNKKAITIMCKKANINSYDKLTYSLETNILDKNLQIAIEYQDTSLNGIYAKEITNTDIQEIPYYKVKNRIKDFIHDLKNIFIKN